MSWVSRLVLLFFAAYAAHMSWTVYDWFAPPVAKEGEAGVASVVSRDQVFDVFAFAAADTKFSPSKTAVLWHGEGLSFEHGINATFNVTLPANVLKNPRPYHVALVLCRHGRVPWRGDANTDSLTTTAFARVVRHHVPKKPKVGRHLATSAWSANETVLAPAEPEVVDKTPKPHWLSEVTFQLVRDLPKFSRNTIPRDIAVSLQMAPGFTDKYLPIFQVDELGVSLRSQLILTAENGSLPQQIHVTVHPVMLGWWRMRLQFNLALEMLSTHLQDESESSQVRSLFTDTSPWLLATTLTVAVLHVMFDVLGFISDISHWRQIRRAAGISQRSLALQTGCQIVILLYLSENDTSLLVLGPAVFSVFLSFWKLWRLYTLSRRTKTPAAPSQETLTARYDQEAMRWLAMVIMPLLVGYTIYALLYNKYASWWSFFISTAAGWVYAFGFVLMTPQLFINYRLKTVAHLPFKVFMYRLFNTVIDDFFSFIIPMPLLHRVSVFRDDIVFIAYLYQRFIYPVDKSRSAALDLDEDESASTHAKTD